MNVDKKMRKELLALLKGGQAHMDFDDAVSGFPMEEINCPVPNGSYLVWHVLEHMRITQWDILEFVRNPRHISPDFPDGYWPEPGGEDHGRTVEPNHQRDPLRPESCGNNRIGSPDRFLQPDPARERVQYFSRDPPRRRP